MRLPNIILIGMPGGGKTKVTEELEKHGYISYTIQTKFLRLFLRPPYPDISKVTEQSTGRKILGTTNAKLLTASKERRVRLSLWVARSLSQENMDTLKHLGRVVHIRRSMDEPDKRAGQSGDCIKADREVCKKLHCELADEIIDSDNLTPKKIAELIIQKAKL